MVISLTGFMGCGKSRVGRELAALIGASFVDLDRLIVERCGCSIPELFSRGGEALFRQKELETLVSVLDGAGDNLTVLALGGGAIMQPAAREQILTRTRSVFLRVRMDTIRERIGDSDPSRPLFSDPVAAEALYASRMPVYEQASVIVDTDGRSPYDNAAIIAARLGF